jgi:hypothetical protein
MYEGTPAKSETAVFASLDDKSTKENDSRIYSVDGKEPSCIEVGCPYWVRILPGTHTFVVRYASDFYWSYQQSGHNYASLTIEVKDMKPRHVYVVRYRQLQKDVQYVVEDLGENPKYGITLGLKGANQAYYPVEF